MADNLTDEQRRKCMSRVKSKDTDIERILRSALHRRGLRFRKHCRDLPGRPDIVFRRSKTAVFVDGDFWHGFRFEERGRALSSFWEKKIRGNIERDRKTDVELEKMGWQVLRIWQHEIKTSLDLCVERVMNAVSKARRT